MRKRNLIDMKEAIEVTPRTPEDIPNLFIKYWNIRRADALAELFEEDADFINVVGLWWNKRKDIFKAHDYGLKVIFNNSDLSAIRIKTKMLADDIAVVHAKIKLTGQTDHNGIEAGVRRTILTFVVRKKENGLWTAVSAQNTDVIGGVETFIRKDDGSMNPVDYR